MTLQVEVMVTFTGLCKFFGAVLMLLSYSRESALHTCVRFSEISMDVSISLKGMTNLTLVVTLLTVETYAISMSSAPEKLLNK